MKVATSILNCDFNKLEEEIKKSLQVIIYT